MTNYRRHFVPGGSYFFTVALADRSATLLTDHIDVLRKAFQRIRRELPFKTEAMVVLPEHLHCVWTLPPETADFSTRWKRIKAEFSHALPAGERRSTSRVKKANAVSGSGGSGNIRYKMNWIGRGMWITSITIP